MLEDNMIKNMVRGFRELIILFFLSEGPMHGYEIMKRFEEVFYVVYPSSVIYPMLRNLEKKRYIKSEWEKEGEREKRMYILTQEGKKALDQARNILEVPAKDVMKTIIGV